MTHVFLIFVCCVVVQVVRNFQDECLVSCCALPTSPIDVERVYTLLLKVQSKPDQFSPSSSPSSNLSHSTLANSTPPLKVAHFAGCSSGDFSDSSPHAGLEECGDGAPVSGNNGPNKHFNGANGNRQHHFSGGGHGSKLSPPPSSSACFSLLKNIPPHSKGGRYESTPSPSEERAGEQPNSLQFRVS